VILDTSFVEDVASGKEAATERAEELAARGVPERLSVITLYELYWSVGYVDSPQRERERLDAVLETKETYDVSPEIARKAGRIAGSLAADGRSLGDPGDELIGATGLVEDEPVLTRNVDHLERIPGLEVVSY
jgi:tRNA(fMet)-specific endonuclease VapC